MLKIYTKKLILGLLKSKAFVFVFLISLLLLGSSIVASQKHAVKQEKVLGAATTSEPNLSLSPSPTASPTPKPLLVTSSPTPTASVPTPTSAPASPSSASSQDSSSTPTPTPTTVPSPTPSPAPAALTVHIGIDYASQKAADSYTVSVQPGQTAWDAIVAAVGANNLEYTDYGGDMGKFITGFNGVSATSNQYYEFRVNGTSSNVGVSSYVLNDQDTLDFVLTSF